MLPDESRAVIVKLNCAPAVAEAGVLLKAIEGGDLEQRLAALEANVKRRVR